MSASSPHNRDVVAKATFGAAFPGKLLGALLAVLALGFLAGGFLSFDWRAASQAGWVLLFLAVSAAFAYGSIFVGLERWRVDEVGIERITPLAKRLRAPWSDIEWVEDTSTWLKWTGNIVLRGHRFGTIEVSVTLVGILALRQVLLARVARAAFPPAVLRHFVAELAATTVPAVAPSSSGRAGNDSLARWRENPLFVLGLRPDCAGVEVERAGQKLLALLAIDHAGAKRLATPIGGGTRTPEMVRAAMAELRDPERRIRHEVWATVEGDAVSSAEGDAGAGSTAPWPEATAVLGLRSRPPRLAYWLSVLASPLVEWSEVRARAVVAGTLALGRGPAVDASAVAWLARKLSLQKRPQVAAVAAVALLAAAQGRKEITRPLLYAIDSSGNHLSRSVRRLARSWLVADAAEQGVWREVAILGRGRTKIPWPFATWLVAEAAQRLNVFALAGLAWRARSCVAWPFAMGTIARRLTTDERNPSDRALRLAWLAAPYRGRTRTLLRRALATSASSAPSNAPPLPTQGDGQQALAFALRAHAVALVRPAASAILAAGLAWDAACASDGLRSHLGRRAATLGTRGGPDVVLAALRETAEADLAPHLGLLPAASLARSATLGAASERARKIALHELESLVAALKERTSRDIPLPPIEEWMAWGALRWLCDHAVRDGEPEVRRAVFHAVHERASDYASWLQRRGELPLAKGILRWLVEEARAVGDAREREVAAWNWRRVAWE